MHRLEATESEELPMWDNLFRDLLRERVRMSDEATDKCQSQF